MSLRNKSKLVLILSFGSEKSMLLLRPRFMACRKKRLGLGRKSKRHTDKDNDGEINTLSILLVNGLSAYPLNTYNNGKKKTSEYRTMSTFVQFRNSVKVIVNMAMWQYAREM
jgi:hypothetical protein